MRSQRGFTLIELLLVTGVITIILAIGTPLYISLSNSTQYDAAMNILVQDLYQAQSYSRNRNQDAQWGVAISNQKIVLFSGSSYASRNTALDITYDVPAAIVMSGSSQIVYSKLYGLPTTTAVFNFSGGGKSGSVTVNNKGMVEY